jgi:hypothetical protein
MDNQAESVRDAQVAAFWRDDDPRFSPRRERRQGVQSPAAHVLVHVDVRWNPMEVEQRVGRSMILRISGIRRRRYRALQPLQRESLVLPPCSFPSDDANMGDAWFEIPVDQRG